MSRRDWVWHAYVPLGVFAVMFLALTGLDLDRPIANAVFYAATGGWLGTGSGDWWAHDLLHTSGRWLVRGVAVGALAGWLLSFTPLPLRSWRHEARYVFLAIVIATTIVGTLKALTNIDCPWDLTGFGGDRPYVALFADRPDYLPQAKCFPGAHSSSGFALMSLYFALRDRHAGAARGALIAGALIGTAFAFGQQARGAHFLSHEIASAAIVWSVMLALYVRMLRRVTDRDAPGYTRPFPRSSTR